MLSVNQPNDYGGRTFEIEISPSYTIIIVETESEEKIVRLLDRGIIFTETEFGVTTEKDLVEALKFSFYKTRSHINEKKGNEWERGRFKRQLDEAIEAISEYSGRKDNIPDLENIPEDDKNLDEYYKRVGNMIGIQEAKRFFQKYKIDIERFYSNYNEISTSPLRHYVNKNINTEPTKSIKEELHKLLPPPPAYPVWFAAAFPDVVLWVQNEVESGNKEIEKRVNKHISYAEQNGRFPYSFFEYVIERYKTHNSIECKRNKKDSLKGSKNIIINARKFVDKFTLLSQNDINKIDQQEGKNVRTKIGYIDDEGSVYLNVFNKSHLDRLNNISFEDGEGNLVFTYNDLVTNAYKCILTSKAERSISKPISIGAEVIAKIKPINKGEYDEYLVAISVNKCDV